MINCIILDDEPLAIKVIENFIKKIDFLNCIGTFPNANDAMGALKKEKVEFPQLYPGFRWTGLILLGIYIFYFGVHIATG